MKLTYPINRFALRLMLFSMCFGILQVVVYAIYPNDTSIGIGIYHLFPTIIIHIFLLLIILTNGIKDYKNIGEHFLVALIMLANIPIALGCFYAVIALSDL